VADNVLAKCLNLRKADFSDIFTTRLKSDLPHSLSLLIKAIEDKPIQELNLSHNAFGPAGVESFKEYLSKTTTLKVLDVTNCGLGPIGGAMIGDALYQNENVKIEEFYASRDRLEERGMEAIARAFAKQ
jgi:Ran GTPase-activating protein 1